MGCLAKELNFKANAGKSLNSYHIPHSRMHHHGYIHSIENSGFQHNHLTAKELFCRCAKNGDCPIMIIDDTFASHASSYCRGGY